VRISVIVATRNRSYAIASCLDSIAISLSKAAPISAEIVVVDNGSEDQTPTVIEKWAKNSPFPVRHLVESRTGLSRAHNAALKIAQGDLLAFTDDDCCLNENYVNDLLRHDAKDTELVLRGGRIELGDPTDLPLTIKTSPDIIQWKRSLNSARSQPIPGQINGCNMTMRRALVQKIGYFDENFGPGSAMGSGGDSDYLFRAYLAYCALEYVPNMTVIHFHGRKSPCQGYNLLRNYLKGTGAVYAKHCWKDLNLCRPFWWDLKNALKETITGKNTWLPAIGFSHKHKVFYSLVGAFRYILYLPFLKY